MRFSVIIPCLNESGTLARALDQLLGPDRQPSQLEIIVCDGGSSDGTLDLLHQYPVTVVTSAAGRALQMNIGARRATGEWLLFLHADTRLPHEWQRLVSGCGTDWGRFDVRLSGQHWLFRVIETAINLRSRKTAVATGDQALFFRRDFFRALGGYPEIPLMEDIALTKMARRQQQPCCIREAATTSSRRWEQKGIIRTMLLMWFLRLAYWLGIKPETLHRLYYP